MLNFSLWWHTLSSISNCQHTHTHTNKHTFSIVSRVFTVAIKKKKKTSLSQSLWSFSVNRKMAGNDWINSYLEAILDVGPGLDDPKKSSLLLRERGHFSPTRYFVEEVITGFDETDLHRSWVRVRLSLVISLYFWISFVHSFMFVFWSENWNVLGCGHQESTGEEHEIGEHVLADLEFGSPEKTGHIYIFFIFDLKIEMF